MWALALLIVCSYSVCTYVPGTAFTFDMSLPLDMYFNVIQTSRWPINHGNDPLILSPSWQSIKFDVLFPSYLTSILEDTFPDRLPELSGGGEVDLSDPWVDVLELVTPDLGSTGDTWREEAALLELLWGFIMLTSTPNMTLGDSLWGVVLGATPPLACRRYWELISRTLSYIFRLSKLTCIVI